MVLFVVVRRTDSMGVGGRSSSRSLWSVSGERLGEDIDVEVGFMVVDVVDGAVDVEVSER